MLKSISNDPLIDGLLWQDDTVFFDVLSWQGSNRLGSGVTLTYSFMTFDDRGLDGFARMNTAQRDAVTSILAMFETFTDVTFIFEPDGANSDIEFGTAGLSFDGTLGITYASWVRNSSYANFVNADVYLANDYSSDYDTPTLGSQAYNVLVHEIGHALGLEHPFEGIILPGIYDNSRYTVMSYTDGFDQPEEPETIMPFDVAALHYLYGANTQHNRSDTTYDLASFDTGSIQTIWDAGGEDTVDLSGLASLASGMSENTVDLNDMIDTGAKVFVSGGMIIENVIGSGMRDVISGNVASNNIQAGAGNDYVNARAGADVVSGGSGNDILVNPDGGGQLLGGAGQDELIAGNTGTDFDGGDDADRIIGSRSQDNLTGGSGNDVIVGDQTTFFFGDDTLTGGDGDDLMMGGAGADTFVFDTNDGSDTIADIFLQTDSVQGADFTPGTDKIELVGFGFATTAQALSYVSDVGGHATFDAPGSATTITFHGLSSADLSASDFILG